MGILNDFPPVQVAHVKWELPQPATSIFGGLVMGQIGSGMLGLKVELIVESWRYVHVSVI